MSDIVIKVENLPKQYRLGLVGTGTLSHHLNRWWAKLRGRPDPTLWVHLAARQQRLRVRLAHVTPCILNSEHGQALRGKL